MRHRLYYHLVWTTRGRVPAIELRTAVFLARFGRKVVREERGRLLEFGVVSTHVHLLLTLHPSSNVPRLVQRLKGASGYLINRRAMAAHLPFRWADGYDIETVSPRQVSIVREYVRTQSSRHPAEAIAGWSGVERAIESLREPVRSP